MRKRAETNLTTESLYHATWHIHITNQRTKQQENSEIIMLSVERKEKKKKNIGKCSAAMAIEIEKLKNTTLNNKQKANTDSRRIHYAILSC